MNFGAPVLGWGALTGAALAASVGPLQIQLAFAVFAIGIIGMAHGASDLAIVPPSRRIAFLLLYLGTSVVCLMWWTAFPAIALPAFLLASAIHFGLEDAPDGSVLERTARGVTLVAAPAVLHQSDLTVLLSHAGMTADGLSAFAHHLAQAGAVASAMLLIVAVSRQDLRLGFGIMILLLLPPLIGFAVGFLVLHALPQTRIRQDRMGFATLASYATAILPILGLALLMTGLLGVWFLQRDHTGVRALFAGIAALAVPHLLVTPWFEDRGNLGPTRAPSTSGKAGLGGCVDATSSTSMPTATRPASVAKQLKRRSPSVRAQMGS